MSIKHGQPTGADKLFEMQPNAAKSRSKPAGRQRLAPNTTSSLITRRIPISIVLLALAALVLTGNLPTAPKSRNSVEAVKTLKALAKTFVFQRLTQKKHFVPLPVPIPVPIEINEKPIYLKGKPKYVNVYQKPKPTPQPVVKPTTVYHMPIYSPTYEYMSMDPMGSMYSSPMVYSSANQHGSSESAGGYKSSSGSDGLDPQGGGGSSGAHSGVDYDDDAGSYYMRKAAAARRNRMSHDYGLHRNDQSHREEADRAGDLAASGSHLEEEDEEDSSDGPQSSNEEESLDHDEDRATRRRFKRQVYYESGYDEHANCDGFPLEVNVRSRIKLDQIFPIHGKSQMKKCIKKKSMPPPSPDDGHIDVFQHIPKQHYPSPY